MHPQIDNALQRQLAAKERALLALSMKAHHSIMSGMSTADAQDYARQERVHLEAEIATLKASGPTAAPESGVHSSIPSPQQPVCEEPTLVLLRTQAQAESAQPPQPVHPITPPETQEEDGEMLLIRAVERSNAVRRARR
jgi:hypothetical protein